MSRVSLRFFGTFPLRTTDEEASLSSDDTELGDAVSESPSMESLDDLCAVLPLEFEADSSFFFSANGVFDVDEILDLNR